MPLGSSEASEKSDQKSLNSFHIAWKKCSSGQAAPCIVLSHSRKCFTGGLFLVTVVLPHLSTPLSKPLMGIHPSRCELI